MSEFLSIDPQELAVRRIRTGETGAKGERLAAEFLERQGYRLVMANFTIPVGRNSRGAQVTGEIDIIALDGETLCFIEVKTRTSDTFAAPTANVDLRKQRQITRASRLYRRTFRVNDMQYRFDVVSIVLAAEPQIELFKGFWNESKFRKRSWSDDEFDRIF